MILDAIAPPTTQSSAFMDDLERGRIPERIPTRRGEWGERFADFSTTLSGISMRDYRIRDRATREFGMWALVDMDWTRRLADWIAGRRVLEIMAGNGWLAKALNLHGVRLTATDNRRLDYQSPPVFPVHKLDAIRSIKRHRADVLIVSWPPYDCSVIVEACKWWGRKPIIYIGESDGGCNAPEAFWQHFQSCQLEVGMPQWEYIHDCVWAGHWRGPVY